MILRLRLLLFSFIIIVTAHLCYGVSFDYYFTALRTEKTCDDFTVKVACQIKCGNEAGMCIGNECYCLSVSKLKKNVIKGIQYERKQEESIEDTPEYLDESNLYKKPTLRHHIAHFCPNLELARDCIRTCMQVGKPAFCGKDHVCYCGHRYSNKDLNPKSNVSNVYAEFHDLYEKYFGPNYDQKIQV